jgi:uncharacterized BrkB/YihY/UPF0761 family membrane protein
VKVGVKGALRSAFTFLKELAGAFRRNNCTMQAAGLTYFSMLAVVPLMCILLFAAKTCHVHDYAERHINERIDALIANMEQGTEDPLAKVVSADAEAAERRRRTAGEFSQEARKVTAELFDRIEKFNVGTLGWVGFGFLLWTVISSMGMVEVSFNGIWGVEKPRKIWQRAWLYLLLALLLPPVAAAAMSLTVLAAVKSAIASVSGAAGVAE